MPSIPPRGACAVHNTHAQRAHTQRTGHGCGSPHVLDVRHTPWVLCCKQHLRQRRVQGEIPEAEKRRGHVNWGANRAPALHAETGEAYPRRVTLILRRRYSPRGRAAAACVALTGVKLVTVLPTESVGGELTIAWAEMNVAQPRVCIVQRVRRLAG